MAYDSKNFGRVSTNTSNELVTTYSYHSADDSLGTIVADNYFDDLIKYNVVLRVNDVIFIVGNNRSGMYKVTSVTTHVTIANFLNETTVVSSDPTVTSDKAQGYSVGSHWINTSDNGIFICADSTNGAAVWLEVTAA